MAWFPTRREILEKNGRRLPIHFGLNFGIFLEIFSEEIAMRASLTLAAIVIWSLSGALITDAQSRKGKGFSEWSAPVNIGPPINTQWDDNVPVLSKDEKTLYFTSNRPGSINGSEDIWVSQRQNKKYNTNPLL